MPHKPSFMRHCAFRFLLGGSTVVRHPLTRKRNSARFLAVSSACRTAFFLKEHLFLHAETACITPSFFAPDLQLILFLIFFGIFNVFRAWNRYAHFRALVRLNSRVAQIHAIFVCYARIQSVFSPVRAVGGRDRLILFWLFHCP